MMKKYLLETDIISYAGDKQSLQHEAVTRHLFNISPEDELYISDLSLYEYRAGLYLLDSDQRKRIIQGLNAILQYVMVLPLSPEEGGEIFGELSKEHQRRTGMNDKALKKHTFDMILASEAICHDMTLVYNDRIHEKLAEIRNDLRIERWTEN